MARHRREEALACAWLPATPPGPGGACGAPVEAAQQQPDHEEITIYPDLALAMLQQKHTAAGRLWLLLRRLDEHGRGWFYATEIHELFASTTSAWRFCSQRQLRNLLVQGNDLFWQRSDNCSAGGRIWLRSPARVAHALGLSQLTMKPVAMPAAVLLDSIGTVRAHFFAVFHSSRNGDKPVSRQTVAGITGVSRRSQQAYEAKSGIHTERNWAVGEECSQELLQQRAWRHGAAVFQLTDDRGKLGPAGQAYIAWQLPNSYCGPYSPQPARANKRINRKLTDLLKQGITGNGERKVDEPTPQSDVGSTSRYHAHGRAAARSYNRDASNDHYWLASSPYRRYRVWYLLAAQGSL